MDYTALAAELTDDPLVRGYAGMTDAQARDDLNTVYRTVKLEFAEGDVMYSETDGSDWDSLTDAQKTLWLDTCGIPRHDVTKGPTFSTVKELFKPGGAASTTWDNLMAYVNEPASRAVELGFGSVTEGDIQNARAI